MDIIRNDGPRGEKLSDKIIRARGKKGYSQEKLAASVGVSAETIRKIEQKKTSSPGIFLIADIASVLELDIKKLAPPRRK